MKNGFFYSKPFSKPSIFNIEYILEYNLYTCTKWDDIINKKPLISIDSGLMASGLMESGLMDSDSIKKIK